MLHHNDLKLDNKADPHAWPVAWMSDSWMDDSWMSDLWMGHGLMDGWMTHG